MLKLYKIGDLLYQYEEGKQPETAEECKPEQSKPAKATAPATQAKAAPTTKNKAKAVANK